MDEFAAVTEWEPAVRALVGWDRRLAEARAQSHREGSLRGWSIGVKDIVDVAGMKTQNNAPFLDWPIVDQNAGIVSKLEDAGAFVLAKTVTSTFAYLDPGETRNPWHLDHTPGGSSSGSAAAVACGMVRLALGTQTIGSINRPASYCGVVGFKPTWGMFDTTGVFPFSPSVDTVGFFTRDVTDARDAYAALRGESASFASGPLRIALVEDLLCPAPDPEMAATLKHAFDRLLSYGHEVRRVSLPTIVEDAYTNHRLLIANEGAQSHEELFREFGSTYPPNLSALIRTGQRVTPEQLRAVQSHRAEARRQMEGLFGSNDVVISGSAPGAAPRGLQATGDPRMNLIWTYLGVPTITLPVRLNAMGLPLGIQVTGRSGQDNELLACALSIEAALRYSARPVSSR